MSVLWYWVVTPVSADIQQTSSISSDAMTLTRIYQFLVAISCSVCSFSQLLSHSHQQLGIFGQFAFVCRNVVSLWHPGDKDCLWLLIAQRGLELYGSVCSLAHLAQVVYRRDEFGEDLTISLNARFVCMRGCLSRRLVSFALFKNWFIVNSINIFLK